MSIESELRKEGIEVIKKIHPLKVNYIATSIAKKLIKNFPEQNFNFNELFTKISGLDMYVAKIPNGIAAKYFYKNSSIYFSESTNLENLNEVAIHECIHALQSVVNSKNKLLKLGLCDFTNSKLTGMALNEAAVQLMTMKCTRAKFDTVKYFDIDIPSNSPDYYPLECNLVRQMAYITGEYVLFNSTLYGNDNFKDKFIKLTSKKDFEIIEHNINYIMHLEDELNAILVQVQNSNIITKETLKLMKKSNKLKEEIKNGFLITQNRIFTSFFDKLSESLYTPDSIKNFRKSLYSYRKLIGVSDNYSFFNAYYINKMEALEEKHNNMTTKSLALIPFKESLFIKAVKKIRTLVGLSANYNYNYNNINMK